MDKLIEALGLIYQLKAVRRTGWVRSGVPDPESVADHSFGVAFLAAVLPCPPGLDRDRATRLALFHDFAESLIGDIISEINGREDVAIRREKEVMEREAVGRIQSMLGGDYEELALEYIDQSSAEARYVKQLDKLDMALQAKWYGNIHTGEVDLSEFVRSAERRIDSQFLLDLLSKFRGAGDHDLEASVP